MASVPCREATTQEVSGGTKNQTPGCDPFPPDATSQWSRYLPAKDAGDDGVLSDAK